MSVRTFILPLLTVLSMVCTAHAQEPQVRRCMDMGPNQNAVAAIGYGLKRIKAKEVDIDDRPVTIMPVMAGLRGPALTLLGRDVRLAVTQGQSSPQELWHHAQWNVDPITDCPPLTRWNWLTRLNRDTQWHVRSDVQMGFTDTYPRFLYRARVIPGVTITRPRGFIFGGALAYTLGGNADALARIEDEREPVRRDMESFAHNGEITMERLYLSWHTTPVSDVHVGVTAGYLEEMYGGAGGEMIWRPFGSAFWTGVDAWALWRRDPDSAWNHAWGDHHFTGHVRAGYDVPFSTTTFTLAAGQYLAGDHGATVGVSQQISTRARLEAGLTWTDRREDQGMIGDTHFDGMMRLTWTMGPRSDARVTMRQMGRDGGQMLERPLPIETFTEPLSARSILRDWNRLLDPL